MIEIKRMEYQWEYKFLKVELITQAYIPFFESSAAIPHVRN